MSTYGEAGSYEVSARPKAERLETTFAELRVGDYMTADGNRWVEVVEIKPVEATPPMISVLFEIPEPVNLRSMETRYWIERLADTPVIVDAAARGSE